MTTTDFFERHRELLEAACTATRERGHWTPFPEAPNDPAYAPEAPAEGAAAFQELVGRHFTLGQPGAGVTPATEHSPWGVPLDITYEHLEPEAAVALAKEAGRAWRRASADTRAGVAVEILTRLHAQSFLMANAVEFTTGQAAAMAFQAGGPHAQDRGLEAVAYAWTAQNRHATSAHWLKPQGKRPPLSMDKTFTPVGRGVALVVACVTFPTWNGYPGLFASLATGNPVLVKPHPRAVLPLALTVRTAREVLAEAGFDPNVVLLVPDRPDAPLAATLATHPDVRIIDFTGSTEFGDWLGEHARQAVLYAEKSGLNTIVLDSTADYRGMLDNLAFSLSLYSGQMCTAPQNLLVPASGLATDEGPKTVEDVGADLAAAIDTLLDHPKRGPGVLGAISGEAVLARLDWAASAGEIVRVPAAIPVPDRPNAQVRSPLIVRLTVADGDVYEREWFGPISFVVTTDSTEQSLELLRASVERYGAITAAVYSTDEAILEQARDVALEAGVHLSENLTSGVYVNQAAAFSDFHGSPANPAATCTLSDPAFVTGRFTTLQSRRHTPA